MAVPRATLLLLLACLMMSSMHGSAFASDDDDDSSGGGGRQTVTQPSRQPSPQPSTQPSRQPSRQPGPSGVFRPAVTGPGPQVFQPQQGPTTVVQQNPQVTQNVIQQQPVQVGQPRVTFFPEPRGQQPQGGVVGQGGQFIQQVPQPSGQVTLLPSAPSTQAFAPRGQAFAPTGGFFNSRGSATSDANAHCPPGFPCAPGTITKTGATSGNAASDSLSLLRVPGPNSYGKARARGFGFNPRSATKTNVGSDMFGKLFSGSNSFAHSG